jgi:hypothetical protein
MESANQLVVSTQEACEHFKIVLLALNEVFVCLALFIRIMCQEISIWSNHLLETLFQKSKQFRLILLLVCGQVQNNLHFKVRKHLQEKNLGPK